MVKASDRATGDGIGSGKTAGEDSQEERERQMSKGEKEEQLCAGINRQEVEDERASREGSSDPLGPEFCAGYPKGAQRSINRGIGGLGIELRKLLSRNTRNRCRFPGIAW